MKLYETLEQQLKKEPNFVTDNGELKKWVVLNKAQNFDEELIGLLLDNAELKDKFFVKVKETLVFNQNLFMRFLEQKNYLNDSYTQYKNKIGLTIDGKYLKQRNEVALVWPFKDCVLEGGQSREEDKREEIFFNEILAQDEITQLLEPKVLTNAKRIDEDGEKPLDQFNRNENGTITDNLIIKGNNLLALHTLKEEFAGKVKLIYIDPPYNTGNDGFKYNDSFNHSSWLTFMKNRLEVAKELLLADGLIFIHLDQIEEAYLKILCDEIFGKENFINSIAVRSSTPSGTKTVHKDKTIIKQKDFILVYKKSPTARINPQYKRKDKWDSHFNYYLDREKEIVLPLIDVLIEKNILPENSSLKDFNIDDKNHIAFYKKNSSLICQTQSHKNEELKNKSKALKDKVLFINKGEENEIMFYNGRQLTPLKNSMNEVIYHGKIDVDFSMLLCDFWDDIDFQNTQNEGGVSFTNGKKPEELLYRIIKLTTNKKDIILDFFAGSGTAGAVAHKMKRQYILCEQMDYVEELPINRIKGVIDGNQSGISKFVNWQGGGDFIYLELKKYNQTFIEQIEEAKNTEALLRIWEQMKEKSFFKYSIDLQKFENSIPEFKQFTLEMQKEVLMELLDKNQLYVNLSSLNDADFACTDDEKRVTKDFYQIKK
jgi:adenine-specific DNA-methyltransferase